MQIVLLILAGIVGGIIGGMGMGGGTLLIPILTIFLDVPQKNAQAINLVAFIPMAVNNIKRKGIDYKSVLLVAAPALITSVISALLVKKISSKALSIGFAMFLIVLGVTMMIDTLRKCIYAYMRKCKDEYIISD